MKKRTFFILLILVVALIWGHSLIPLTSSAEESLSVMRILQKALDVLHIPITLTDQIVRKLAHFTEHAVLGLVMGLYIYPKSVADISRRRRLICALIPVAVGFMIGFFDETIQLFTGRGASITDVWIDFAGVVTGAGAAFVIALLMTRKKRE